MCVMQDAIVMKCSLFQLYALKNMPLLCGRQNTPLLSAFAVLYNQKRRKKVVFRLVSISSGDFKLCKC